MEGMSAAPVLEVEDAPVVSPAVELVDDVALWRSVS